MSLYRKSLVNLKFETAKPLVMSGLLWCHGKLCDLLVTGELGVMSPTASKYLAFVHYSSKYFVVAASQNSRSGSIPKTHRRSRPPIQTCDPDRSRPHDPDLWSRPMIQTPCFILFGFVDPDPLFYFGVNMLVPAPSLPLWLDCGFEGHAV